MRLLPDQEGAYGRRRFTTGVVGHLLPTQAIKALAFGDGFSTIALGFCIPVEVVFHQSDPVPQGKMHGMPPVHFQVRLAIPAVIGQPGFLWRKIWMHIVFWEVLGQDHSPLQLWRAAFLLPAEINRATALPELFPTLPAVVVQSH